MKPLRILSVNFCSAVLCLLGVASRGAEFELPWKDGLTSYLYTPTEKPDPAKTYWLVVGVHGLGGKGHGACGVADWAQQFDDVVVLGPTFSTKREDKGADVYQLSGPPHEAKLDGFIAEISKTWKLRPKIFLHGFSAGAQFSHRHAFKHPERVAGVSAHSAGTWAKMSGADSINRNAKGVPFAISCGEEDKASSVPGVPSRITAAQEFAGNLKTLGFSVEFKTWPGVGHQQTAQAKAMGRALLEKLRQSKP